MCVPSEETGLIIAPTIHVEHLKNILLLHLITLLLHNLLFTHWNHLRLLFGDNLPLFKFAIGAERIDDVLDCLVVSQHLLVVTATLG